ncbi:MAG: proline--tRNA ligase [Simkaniaceae bacterium]|nr:proline--tRNA ligase [Simkaniaceae bacterium]MCF7852498.1 proline--tRNA ligase [Simkaniaceae bacterium]
MAPKTAVTPTRSENFPGWYQEAIKLAELAEHSPVRGCMVIKPWGYAMWEHIQRGLDARFKALGVQNAYFPLFIPLSYFEKEAEHVEGFAKECAVVTHHRLEQNGEGKLIPASPLEEPLIVRPTSEMIIGEMFAKWIESYRDLPLKINQWANVVRWEMRPRIFLRTAEFLWQEGHTAYATKDEAMEDARKMLDQYAEFCEESLALPGIRGEKSENERFPGADHTYTFEMMMQDQKALQACTSHFLGQNFSKAAGIKYLSQEGKEELAWTTSWGFTTRIIGAMIMVHGDDDGIILPPAIAPSHVVIIPIIHKEETKETILNYCEELSRDLKKIAYKDRAIDSYIDQRDLRGGEKIWHWIKKGVPIRIEVGMREIEEGKLCVALRTLGHKDKKFLSREEVLSSAHDLLDEVHRSLYHRAKERIETHITQIEERETFYQFFAGQDEEASGGFARVFWAGDTLLEEKIKQDLNVTIRCIPFDGQDKEGICPFTGKTSHLQVIFAKSY